MAVYFFISADYDEGIGIEVAVDWSAPDGPCHPLTGSRQVHLIYNGRDNIAIL